MSTRAPEFALSKSFVSGENEKSHAMQGRMRYLIKERLSLTASIRKVPDMIPFFPSAGPSLANQIFDSYGSYSLSGITTCRFTQADMLNWIRPFENGNLFVKSGLGFSGEGRPISLYSIGHGSVQVMLWSQMHGDEPTATMALLDIFNFFSKNPEHIITKTIREQLTLLVIPMLNPDGAQRFTRRTAQLIDLNRDALALETPEARILKECRERYQPEYGFNLHDQESRLTVGTTKKITAVALLAPSVDDVRSDTPVQIKAKKVASTMAQVLNQFIPGHLAKWDDTFEPRAFGDNIQKWGTSTVLVESGGWKGDPNKFFIRKLNCVGLLVTLYAIATGETEHADTTMYENIPFNTKLGCDHIIRNAVVRMNPQTGPIKVDIGINYDVRVNPVSRQLEDYATIIELGDLRTLTALEQDADANQQELDADRILLDRPFPKDELQWLLKRK
jgi:hypothetical protein